MVCVFSATSQQQTSVQKSIKNLLQVIVQTVCENVWIVHGKDFDQSFKTWCEKEQ